jgi:16S rRNA (guanine966-N2)-methyltransferase
MGLRIIGGKQRGRRLAAPAGRETRPSAARLREAVFNILRNDLTGSIVLDLFAGSGALGLEALSRGARRSVFVENRRDAVKVIHANIATCGMQEATETIRRDIRRGLDCLAGQPEPFDLVFIDPPYGQGLITPALSGLVSSGCMQLGALIMIEHGVDDPLVLPERSLVAADHRRYGKSLVSFVRFMV